MAQQSHSVTGRIAVHPRGFGFLTLDAPVDGVDSAFVAPPDLNPLLAGDRVRATITRSRPGRWSASDLELVARERTTLFGTVTRHGDALHLRVDRSVANTDWPIDSDEPLDVGAHVSAALDGGRVVDPRVVAEADASLERVIARHEIRTVFPEAVESAPTEPTSEEEKGRRDLRELVTITIDAPSSRDLDDALSVLPAGPDGAIRVLVSIADVDALVPLGSETDVEAHRRGTSVYLAGRVVPMLPRGLSEDALSLLPEVERLALTVEMRIDTEGAVTAVDVYRSLIKCDRRLSYAEVTDFLELHDASAFPEPVVECLRWLRAAGARLSAVRRARGGVKLLREEAYVRIDADTREPVAVVVRTDTAANELIERMMVAANEAVARWLSDRGLPAIYRVHAQPDGERVTRLAESARHLGFETGLVDTLTPRGLAALEEQLGGSSDAGAALGTILRGALGPARYTVHPSMHFGLAAPLYLHFTSPIRRYADLTVHRIVKGYLRGDRDRFAGDEALEELAQHLEARARGAAKAETERLRMVAARHFAGQVGEAFDGYIIAIKPFGLIVQLRGVGVAGTVSTDALDGGPFEVGPARHRLLGASRTFTVGESLAVTIESTDDELGRIELTPSG